MGKYSSIAASDFAVAVTHAYAALYLWQSDYYLHGAALGLLVVAATAIAGIFRFSISEQPFAPIHDLLTDASALIGLPMVGMRVLMKLSFMPREIARPVLDDPQVAWFVLVVNFCVYAGFFTKQSVARELCSTVFAVVFFIMPLCVRAYSDRDWCLLGSTTLFAVAGAVIGPKKDELVFDLRKINVFHYLISAGILGIARCLPRA